MRRAQGARSGIQILLRVLTWIGGVRPTTPSDYYLRSFHRRAGPKNNADKTSNAATVRLIDLCRLAPCPGPLRRHDVEPEREVVEQAHEFRERLASCPRS